MPDISLSLFLIFFFFFFFDETLSPTALLTEDDLGLPLLLPPHPELCDYRHALLCWEWNPGLQVSWASILPI